MEEDLGALCHWKWRSNDGRRAQRSKREVVAPADKVPPDGERAAPSERSVKVQSSAILPPAEVDCDRLSDTVPRDGVSDRRQVCNERISLRPMVIRTAMNPYLLGRDYLRDLQVQDTFLRPRDSNIKEEG